MEFVFERVFVETPVDTDGDGKLDLVAAYIRRPVSNTEEKVPVVMVANPYMMTCNEDWYDLYDVNRELKVYEVQNLSRDAIAYDYSVSVAAEPTIVRKTAGYAETSPVADDFEFDAISDLYPYLNEKGYATVLCGGLGTLGSDGYVITGSQEELLAFKSVIDWLNGRCRAFTNKTDNIEIKASWCTGKVAMSAKSYLGTLCIGVASTGVDGLETIIPEAAICSWYDYYREGGLVVPPLDWQGDDIDILAKYCFSRAKDEADYATCKDAYEEVLANMREGSDRKSGNYNTFWDERNYLNQMDNFKASVFMIHGLNDWNVKTRHCANLFRALEEKGIERKMLLHQGEHIYVYDLDGAGTLPMIERWLDHYLRGVDNGIEKEPKVLVESNLDQRRWMASEQWPPAEVAERIFPVCTEEKEAVIQDDLSATVYNKEADNQKEWLDELVLSEDADYRNCLKLVWDPFEDAPEQETIRISGETKVAFDAAIDRKTAILSAMLVDLGEACRILPEQKELRQDEEHAVTVIKGLFEFDWEEVPSRYKVISRGHLNAQNRKNLWSKEEIQPGEFYHYEFSMVPTDYTLEKGHKLALILYGIDAQQTLRPETVTEITVKIDSVEAWIPMSGCKEMKS